MAGTDHTAPGMRDAAADDSNTPPVDVPYTELSAAALDGVIESFVLREGTDYGASETSFTDKVAAVRRQLERGDARITFDPGTKSVTLVLAGDLPDTTD